MTENNKKLVRGLSLLDATMIVVGSMIGSGIFITSAESARLVGSPGWLIMAWALAGLMTISGALCLAEVAAMMPRAGGPYIFLREAYSPAIGFLFGWAQFLVVQTGTIAAVAVAFANFTGVIFPAISGSNYVISPIVFGYYAVSLSTQQVLAMLVIIILTCVNTRGLQTGKKVQNIFTFTKTAALLALVILGLTIGWNANSAAAVSDWWNPTANGWNLEAIQPAAMMAGTLAFWMVLGRAMTGPLFSQSAWNNVTFTAGEVEDPGRNLPRALLIGCLIVVALYITANLAYVVTLPLAEIQNAPNNRVGTALMQHIFGPAGAWIMALAIMISTFGCNNGLILAGARVYYAMARDGLFFKRLAGTNSRSVPAMALIAQCVWACILVLPRTVTYGADNAPIFGNVYTQLLEYIVSVELVFGALAVLAVIVLRFRKPELERPYRTWGYPVIPIVFLVLSALLVINLAFLAPGTSGIGYLIALTGIPIYFIWRSRAAKEIPEQD
ncbi:MAG TPA: amino acid permease [Pyrinomonadaceae bacterium]|jgi:APA family basic amino acid/polyamine antiporter|nr:amino acid permease [Pyrinomonadaceae bacterium]